MRIRFVPPFFARPPQPSSERRRAAIGMTDKKARSIGL
jgi:hypothetical protein